MKKTKPRTRRSPQRNAQPKKTALVERKFPFRRFAEVPNMKGRVLEKVEFYTTTEYHSLTLTFEDQTTLTLVIDPCFLISSSLSDFSTGNERVLKRWPTIQSRTNGA